MPRPRNLKLERTWRRHFEEQRSGGLSIREYCFAHDLAESAFHAWRRIIAERDQECDVGKTAMPAFVPVTVVDVATSDGNSPIDIRLANGRRVRVRSGCDRDLLAAVLAILEGRPC
jgi:hypothetical protein